MSSSAPPTRAPSGVRGDPEHVEEQPGAGQDRPLEATAPARERPRLVDDQLRPEEPLRSRFPGTIGATVMLIAA